MVVPHPATRASVEDQVLEIVGRLVTELSVHVTRLPTLQEAGAALGRLASRSVATTSSSDTCAKSRK